MVGMDGLRCGAQVMGNTHTKNPYGALPASPESSGAQELRDLAVKFGCLGSAGDLHSEEAAGGVRVIAKLPHTISHSYV